MKIISMNKNRKEIRKDIISDLREPHDIGIEVKAKEAISYAKVTPNLRNIIRAIMASLSLGVLFFFIIIPIVIFIALLIVVFIFSVFNFSSINNNINEYH